MLEFIEGWFVNKNYWKGVVIYGNYEKHDARKLEILKKARTSDSIIALEHEFLNILKENHLERIIESDAGVGIRSVTIKKPKSEVLYMGCRSEADLLYKSVMNMRANLFAMAEPNSYKNINAADEIIGRKDLALSVMRGFKKVSELYDRAEFVKVNGVLPEVEFTEIPDVPDVLVKLRLDNLRKSRHKLKVKVATPKRLQLLQQKEEEIKLLEARWKLLK